MRHLLVILSIVLTTNFASAYVFTCTCAVQRNNGEVKRATLTVEAYNQQSALSISRNPCYNAAVNKFEFLSNFSNPVLVSHQCGAGAIYNIQ